MSKPEPEIVTIYEVTFNWGTGAKLRSAEAKDCPLSWILLPQYRDFFGCTKINKNEGRSGPVYLTPAEAWKAYVSDCEVGVVVAKRAVQDAELRLKVAKEKLAECLEQTS